MCTPCVFHVWPIPYATGSLIRECWSLSCPSLLCMDSCHCFSLQLLTALALGLTLNSCWKWLLLSQHPVPYLGTDLSLLLLQHCFWWHVTYILLSKNFLQTFSTNIIDQFCVLRNDDSTGIRQAPDLVSVLKGLETTGGTQKAQWWLQFNWSQPPIMIL